jgi:hypothetical protein
LLKERCVADGLDISDEVLARQFRLHLHRGISYLATPQMIRSIDDLVKLATEAKADPDMPVGEASGSSSHDFVTLHAKLWTTPVGEGDQRSEGQKSGGRKSEVGGQRSVVGGRWSVVRGQRIRGCGPRRRREDSSASPGEGIPNSSAAWCNWSTVRALRPIISTIGYLRPIGRAAASVVSSDPASIPRHGSNGRWRPRISRPAESDRSRCTDNVVVRCNDAHRRTWETSWGWT